MTIAYNIHVIVREGGDLDFFFAFIFLNKECFQQNNFDTYLRLIDEGRAGHHLFISRKPGS
jgi:hypothetical protein